jgi:hypothetical protein
MAITHSNIRDAKARFQALVAFLAIGLALGLGLGFHIETGKLGDDERKHAAAYFVGKAYTATGLTGAPRLGLVYQVINDKVPASAQALDNAADRVLTRWPLLGLAMGLGLLALYSNFLKFAKAE